MAESVHCTVSFISEARPFEMFYLEATISTILFSPSELTLGLLQPEGLAVGT